MNLNPDEPTYRCRQCLDDPAGWIALDCPEFPCGHEKDHARHSFCVKCPCWLKAHRNAIHKSSQDALAKGQSLGPLARALQDVDAGIYQWRDAKTAVARWAVGYLARRRQMEVA